MQQITIYNDPIYRYIEIYSYDRNGENTYRIENAEPSYGCYYSAFCKSNDNNNNATYLFMYKVIDHCKEYGYGKVSRGCPISVRPFGSEEARNFSATSTLTVGLFITFYHGSLPHVLMLSALVHIRTIMFILLYWDQSDSIYSYRPVLTGKKSCTGWSNVQFNKAAMHRSRHRKIEACIEEKENIAYLRKGKV